MSELPGTAFGVMRLLPETKDEIKRFGDQLIRSVQEGEINPLQLKAMLKAIEIMSKNVTEAIDENILREAERYGEKRFSAYGFSIEKAENGVKYDYLSCGDPEYDERHAAFETAKQRLEERAKFLKALKEPQTIVHEPTGEVTTIRPPAKSGKDGLKFTLQ